MAKLNITFSPEGFEDYTYFQSKDRKMVKKINDLLKSIDRDGALDGIGKPEKLVGNLSGYYSRRINQEHRLVYTVNDDAIMVVACRYHY
ncbi:TPA: Txe/YoeB family addiction module toxin [Staphylococcus aureus]|nr:Txe/YoeB family addiction module toxin [Staphylococcus aureus]